MNVGIFIKDISPEAGGGFTFQETVVNSLVSQKSSHKITVFHYGPKRKNNSDLENKVQYVRLASNLLSAFIQKICFRIFGYRLQLPIFYISRFTNLKLPFPYVSVLDRKARKHQIDLVIFPSPEFEPVEAPYICTVWDLEHRTQPYFPEVSTRGQWKYREKFYREMLTRASYVITGTQTGKNEICNFFGVAPERVRLLPHPTPAFALEQTSRESSDATITKIISSGPFIFYPAQFWAHKNHLALLLALKELKQKINLVFVGSDKGNKSYIKQKTEELELTDQVYFLGFVSRETLIALYKNAVAMIYPSLCGPENLPPLEAFALGCPVIASDIPGSQEQLGDNAILVKWDRPQNFSRAISEMMNNKELRISLIEKGFRRARGYTENEFVRDLNNIIEEFAQVRNLWDRSDAF